MVVSGRKKTPAKELTARLLVLGDHRVGKSASIVRFTTGRFIQEYADSTHQWLYRHKIDSRFVKGDNQPTRLEIIEQIDSDIACMTKLNHRQYSQASDLSSILCNLQWADAYIILYAINDINSYTKAVRYLSLIENFIDSTRNKKINHYSYNSKKKSLDNNHAKFGRTSPVTSSTRNPSKQVDSVTPVLLIGNKKEFESSGGRQVSTSEAKSLASRHGAAFAEISVAQSNVATAETILDFISLLKVTHLRDDSPFNDQDDQSPIVSLLLKEPSSSSPVEDEQTGERQLNGSILAKSVCSRPVVASMVHSTCVLSAACIEPNKAKLAPITCRSVQSGRAASGKKAMSPLYELTTQSGPKLSKAPAPVYNYQGKYEHLKSSFRKASLAIVNGKRVIENRTGRQRVSKALHKEDQSGNRSSSSTRTSIDSGELEASESGGRVSTVFVASSNWIKSHMKSKSPSVSSSSDTKLDGNQSFNAPKAASSGFGVRLRKPLLMYSSRRKTVAFEPIIDDQVSDDNDLSEPIIKTCLRGRLVDVGSKHDSMRCSSRRSSSSLSTSDTFGNANSTLEFDWPDQNEQSLLDSTSATPSSIALSNDTQISTDSRCDLSRASMSATDSNEITDDDEETPPTLRAATNQLPSGGLGKRYQLVKEISTNLSNLSNLSKVPPKRSFCSSLFKNNNVGLIDLKSSEASLAEEVK